MRNDSNVEEEEMPGVSDVDFEEEERCGQGGQPSTATTATEVLIMVLAASVT